VEFSGKFTEHIRERVCVNCETNAQPLQLYCEECGCILADVLVPWLAPTYIYGVQKHRDNTQRWGRGFFHAQAKLYFQSETDGRYVLIPLLSEPMLIGRGSSANMPSSYVDLSMFGAAQCGVARFHAQVEQRNYTLYLSDLESTSGTCLDGQRLTAHAPYPIRNWSIIDFGRLVLRVRYV
jgi:FHA domain